MLHSTVKLRVAICGNGIGGLTHAYALSRFPSISVNVYESTPELSVFGAGIGMWPRTWAVLEAMGLADDMRKVSLSFPAQDKTLAFSFRRSDQAKGIEFLKMKGRGNLTTFHRGHFQGTVLRRLPPSCQIHYSKRLNSYSRDDNGPIRLHFQDGTTATCDVLVGADGIRSVTRSCLLLERSAVAQSKGRSPADTSQLDPEFSGWTAYRSLIPCDGLGTRGSDGISLPQHPVVYIGQNNFIIVYPVSFGQMINLVVFNLKKELQGSIYPGHWSENVGLNEVYSLTSFEKWEPEARAWLKLIQNPTKWAIHTVKPLSSYVFENVALLGDAAHACVPHQGTGAGQAIEDAYILAELLGHSSTTRDTIPRALRIYDSIRRPWTQEVANRAQLNGRYLALGLDGFDFDNSPVIDIERNLRKLGSLLMDNWKWSWETDVREVLQKAIERLEEV
uniref:Putative salicylate hydroxylase n=1 Tax=Moniliophthora roreri TaxID=221103 RepID=A0A0W0FUL0_MONRR